MTHWRPALLVAASLGIVGCASPSALSGGSHTTHEVQTTHTTMPEGTRETTTLPSVTTQTTHPSCTNGTVTVRSLNVGQPTPFCVTVGSTIVLTGGEAMSGGTWPGPPTISNTSVVALISSSASGTSFTANLRAGEAGSAIIEVPFVAGPDVCNPTPCTPVPGAPLIWQVTVVR